MHAHVYDRMACEMTTDSSCNSKHGDRINRAWQTSALLSTELKLTISTE
jgi:hypothetical protein